MKKFNYLIVPITAVLLVNSGITAAKKPEGRGNPHHDRYDKRWENSNKQSGKYSKKGKDRAEERHRLKELKKQAKKRDRYHEQDYAPYDHDDYDTAGRHREYDRYESQRYEERYRNNPIDLIIEHNVNKAKSKIDDVHRKAINTIDEKTRAITGVETHREQQKPNYRSWWWPFDSE